MSGATLTFDEYLLLPYRTEIDAWLQAEGLTHEAGWYIYGLTVGEGHIEADCYLPDEQGNRHCINGEVVRGARQARIRTAPPGYPWPVMAIEPRTPPTIEFG